MVNRTVTKYISIYNWTNIYNNYWAGPNEKGAYGNFDFLFETFQYANTVQLFIDFVLIHQKLENWHSQRGLRWGHVTMTLTFDLLTPKSIGVFLSLSSICVWSMKSVGQTLFELSRYKEVWTDGQTDRQTDKVITIGLPHLRWRGPNKCYSILL